MQINKQFLIDSFGWGFLLWLIGYVISIILFMLVPVSMIGWIITPLASTLSIWVLISKIKSSSFQYYFILGVIWFIIALVFDYFLIVKLFKPEDGYYKLDVYIYYFLTFFLTISIGWWKQEKIVKN